MLITSGSYKVTRFSGYNNMDWEVSFLKHFSIFAYYHLFFFFCVGGGLGGLGEEGGWGEEGGCQEGSTPSRFALRKPAQFP